jgi:uncharacterized protein YkwD
MEKFRIFHEGLFVVGVCLAVGLGAFSFFDANFFVLGLKQDVFAKQENEEMQKEKEDSAKRMQMKIEEEQRNLEKEAEMQFQGTAEDVMALLNVSRRQVGIGELATNGKLIKAANLKVQEIENEGYYQKDSQENLFEKVFLKEAGYVYNGYYQSVVFGCKDAQCVVNKWLDSEKTKDSVLDVRYEDFGLATKKIRTKNGMNIVIFAIFGNQLKQTKCLEIRADCPRAKNDLIELERKIGNTSAKVEKLQKRGRGGNDYQSALANLDSLNSRKEKIVKYLDYCESRTPDCEILGF